MIVGLAYPFSIYHSKGYGQNPHLTYCYALPKYCYLFSTDVVRISYEYLFICINIWVEGEGRSCTRHTAWDGLTASRTIPV